MRAFLLALVLAATNTPRAPAQSGDYEIVQIDPAAGTFSTKLNGQVRTFRVRPAVEVTINGLKAAFAEIEPGMNVKITTAEPGVASRLAVTGVRARTPPDPQRPVLGAAGQSSRKVKATIAANSPDGYPLGDIRKGTRISLQYVEGKWKAVAHIAQFNPDGNTDPEFTVESQLAIALPAKDGKGEILAIVPTGTKKRPFVFQAEEDYPGLVLRIKGGQSTNPGRVTYEVIVLPPPR